MKRGNRGCQGRTDEEGKIGTKQDQEMQEVRHMTFFFFYISTRIMKLVGHRETMEIIPNLCQHIVEDWDIFRNVVI